MAQSGAEGVKSCLMSGPGGDVGCWCGPDEPAVQRIQVICQLMVLSGVGGAVGCGFSFIRFPPH